MILKSLFFLPGTLPCYQSNVEGISTFFLLVLSCTLFWKSSLLKICCISGRVPSCENFSAGPIFSLHFSLPHINILYLLLDVVIHQWVKGVKGKCICLPSCLSFWLKKLGNEGYILGSIPDMIFPFTDGKLRLGDFK